MTVARTEATGRGELDPRILTFTTSLPVDQALYAADIAGSLAHVRMLEDCQILTSPDAEAIRKGLVAIYRDAAGGGRPWPPEEDIHMAVEAELARRIGEPAGRLHTARSRNDQVALDARLFLREQTALLLERACAAVDALVARARGPEGQWLLPAYTHRQRAQPITVAYLLSAYAQMLVRDGRRLGEVLEALDECPLGVGAVSGTSLRTDRSRTAAYLRLSRLTANGLDTVGDRDFALDFTYACARALMHLSRVSQDLVDFSSQEFGFVKLEDSIACGSSMMPQKKNPDVFELLRGKSSRALGNLTALFATLKGLPVGYMRDLQEDKSYIETAAVALSCLEAFVIGLGGVRFVRERMEAALADGMTLATDLAERMVAGGAAFRDAYRAVGAKVQEAQDRGAPLSEVAGGGLTARAAVDAKQVPGGTAPPSTDAQLAALEEASRALRARAAQVPRLEALLEALA
ncbi:MAG TPA: argininosuccinate lyase [Myxococcales bacterium]|nr:argininosuccinate lyase [Myxococcales bacterium]